MEYLGSVEKHSHSYNILRKIYVNPWHWLWYKKRIVLGRENLPQNHPLIFAPNHQNALMDALALLCTNTFQIVWLARADIFANNTLRKILLYMKILPVYRQRDGAESLGRNETIFNKAVEILTLKRPIGLFPEATHWGFRRLRATKKAVPRIAFMAEEANNFNLNLRIVPVALYFDNYTNFRKNLIVIYGKSFSIEPFFELYKENPNKAYTELKNKLDSEMRLLMIDIHHEDLYVFYETIRTMYGDSISEKYNFSGEKIVAKYFADKAIVDILDATLEKDKNTIENIKELTESYIKERSKLNFRENTIRKGKLNVLQSILSICALIITAPIFISGFLLNIIPFYFPYRFITEKKIDDEQFKSSVNFVLAILLFPIYYTILGVIIYQTIIIAPIFILIMLSIPISGICAFEYYAFLKKTIASLRYTIRGKQIKKLQIIRNSISENIDVLCKININLIEKYREINNNLKK